MPEFRDITAIETERLALTSVEFRAKAEIYNPNRVRLTVERPQLQLMLNDYQIGSITADEDIKIKGRSTFSVPVKFRVGPKDTFREGTEILRMLFKGESMSIGIKGEIGVKAYGLIRKKVSIQKTKTFVPPKLF